SAGYKDAISKRRTPSESSSICLPISYPCISRWLRSVRIITSELPCFTLKPSPLIYRCPIYSETGLNECQERKNRLYLVRQGMPELTKTSERRRIRINEE